MTDDLSPFEQAFRIVVIGEEGGLADDPRDPGGLTNFGISQAAFPTLDIRNLKISDALEIYRTHYWGPAYCDSLPPPLAVAVFDCAVNQGPNVAIRILQRALGASITEDGVFGPVTQDAVKRASLLRLLSLFMTERSFRYSQSENFPAYRRTWIGRTYRVAMLAWKLYESQTLKGANQNESSSQPNVLL